MEPVGENLQRRGQVISLFASNLLKSSVRIVRMTIVDNANRLKIQMESIGFLCGSYL